MARAKSPLKNARQIVHALLGGVDFEVHNFTAHHTPALADPRPESAPLVSTHHEVDQVMHNVALRNAANQSPPHEGGGSA